MVRLFSIKHCWKHLIYVGFFLSLNILLFILHPANNRIERETPKLLDHFNVSFSFDPTSKQSIFQYFKHKEETMKQSPFKTILRHTFEKPLNKTSFLIYEYTKRRQFCKRKNTAQIYISTCPFKNCYYTCNSSLIHTTDVILMLYSQLNYEKVLDFNVNRKENQIWLLWHDEPYPPSSIYNKLLFNWTMSYRSDSEISVGSYGITFRRNVLMDQSSFHNWIDNNFNNRRNQVAWFVSNCGSKKRLEYYTELKNYFPISAYGRCIVAHSNTSRTCTRSSNCELEELSISKFYLAFESTTLRVDYITEKFWRSLSHGLIPIVLGPKRQDYEKIAPPNSFIYAEDYKDPQTLAKYLHDVAINKNEYEKYHTWRINYETHHRSQDVESFRFCELCYKLNTNRDHIWYNDLHSYFLETN